MEKNATLPLSHLSNFHTREVTFLLCEGMGIAVVVRGVCRDVWHADIATVTRDGLFSCSRLIVMLAKL